MLSPHVDRLPLVSSCIINVAQDVDEDWPIEVIDRHGNAVNITMQPGDMVLYESHSLIHSRPFALKGRYYANIFIHFEPTGRPLPGRSNPHLGPLDDFYPPYIVLGSPEQEHWRMNNPQGWRKPSPNTPIQQVKSPEGHRAAATGDTDRVHSIAKENRKALHARDANGWQPLHEAVRSGHAATVQALIQYGVDVNARVGKDGKGSSALNLALQFHSADHEVTRLLQQHGAQDLFPEL
jgi:prolyl 4-hydroxylase